MPHQSHLLVDAAFRRPTHRRPIWLMRQAGRYLPEYHEVRADHDFLELVRTPDLAVEVSLQPWRRFRVDGVIVFSDILVPPEAMGMSLSFGAGGPRFAVPVRSIGAVRALEEFDPEARVPYLYEAIRTLVREVNDEVPVIGFAGAPFTLATYMIEGGSSRHFQFTKWALGSKPEALHELLAKLARVLVPYLGAQAEAGAQVLQLFDTWGSVLEPALYREFALPYVQEIFTALRRDHPNVPLIYYVNGAAGILEEMAASGAHVVSIDWRVDLGRAREQLGDRVALQGNLDPCLLLGERATIDAGIARLLDAFGRSHGLIGNLGHGVLPFIPPDNVGYFVRKFQERSQGYANVAPALSVAQRNGETA